jgi:hypothetical protein
MAEARGVTTDAIVREALDRILAEDQLVEDRRPLQTAADIVLECMRDVPMEAMAAMPRDGAGQHDQYIYGWPRRGVTKQHRTPSVGRSLHARPRSVARDGRQTRVRIPGRPGRQACR